MRDHLSVEFGERTRRLQSVGIFRSRRGFSTRDHETMRFLIPHLRQSTNNARLATEAVLRTGEANLVGILHLDADACPQDLPIELREALSGFFLDHTFSVNRLPEVVERWITGARKLLERGALDLQARPLRVPNAAHTLELRIFRQRLEPGYLVTARQSQITPSTPVHLTPRETQVLHWLREGKRNDEIAVILGMGVTTVKTHLKHIYHKLGVENRTAAARTVVPGLAVSSR